MEDTGNTDIEIILAVLAVQHDVCSAAQQIRLRKNSTTTAYKLHPGVIGTQLAEEAGGLTKLFYWLGKPFMQSPKSGTETPIYLATSEEVTSASG
ncbi:MAG: hypothetical protein GWN00_12420 [Aliifodinibius sp.]|nr:hypothetical protein [Fodinibius sp.]NIV11947.1 hypothetical protein [Fodinibius sp.]NIY25583.1 hypothetical protein [Fodinibius sp.]